MTTSSNSDQRRPSQESVDVSILREVARSSLVHALNSVSLLLQTATSAMWPLTLTVYEVNGAKTLVLDPSLAGPLSLVTEVSLLQVHVGYSSLFSRVLMAGDSNTGSIRCSGWNQGLSPR
jgi:vacuolar protein sorting-associated protein 33A